MKFIYEVAIDMADLKNFRSELNKIKRHLTKQVVMYCLEVSKGNVTEAARIMGLDRGNFGRLMRNFKIVLDEERKVKVDHDTIILNEKFTEVLMKKKDEEFQ